jgi:hypothetical protein
VKAKEWRKRDENPDRESKRRPLGWIIDRQQTAKCCTKHQLFSRRLFQMNAGHSRLSAWICGLNLLY